MKTLINYPVKVLVTGLIVLIFLSLPLFWIRLACEASITENIPEDARIVEIKPTGLVPPEFENDPNIVIPSRVSARLQFVPTSFLGVTDYFRSRFPGGQDSNVYFFDYMDEKWIYFDKESGQIVYFYIDKRILPDKTSISKNVQLYIGPDGISEMPDENLGKFTDPIIDRCFFDTAFRQYDNLILYDKILRCFFKINFKEKTVVKGPEALNNSLLKPIEIGLLSSQSALWNIKFTPPQIKDFMNDSNEFRLQSIESKSIIPFFDDYNADPYLLVLDETGRIYLLDKETLEFTSGTPEIPGSYGWLLAPETYFGTTRYTSSKNLSGYEIRPLVLNKYYRKDSNEPKMSFGQPNESFRAYSKIEREYLGMFVASFSDDGTSMAFTVFDKHARKIHLEHTKLAKQEGARTHYIPSSKVAYWGTPWAPFSSICKYLVENVHPPILSFASTLTASSFEAGAGYRSLFLLPNSFVAMNARNGRGNTIERYLSSLWIMVPSIILSIWLAIRVKKDAVVTGLSENARTCWILGTLAFGLAAYITFKLTKPKIKLVTCQNCGQPRRPDMEKCHRCKSSWHVPELTPPNWRVLGIAIETPNKEN